MSRTPGPFPVARWRFALGAALACLLLLALAEVYLRLFPPRDLHPYLGESSPLTGFYTPDDDFTVTYRTWDDFQKDNAERLQPYLPLHGHPDRRPLWAFFGNSFVQAPDMLADTARARVTDHRIFNLGRNEPLFVRMAQIKLLLAHGLKPERIFFLLMPVDLLTLGPQPLDTIRVTARGALTYAPRLPPGPLGWLVDHSRTAFTAWARAGRQRGNPGFRPRTLGRGLDEPLRSDLTRLFAHLARVTQEHRVPVTVMLVPAYEQIMGREPFGLQDALAPILRAQGFDVFDPRHAFANDADRPALFLPDKHFNARGNDLLLGELRQHLQAVETHVGCGAEGRKS